jgi:predicted NAD/FAD-binding protein
VRAERRGRDRVEVAAADGVRAFDHAIFAVHADQALRLLADPSPLERRVLGSIGYQENEVVLHTDASLLPRSRHARASWNYRVPRDRRQRVLVTYDMNRLQRLDSRQRLLVTLNGSDRIDPGRVLHRWAACHPVFDAEAMAAQKLHGAISGLARTHYCGAYWGFGFHEDGVASALAVCARLPGEG